MVSHTAILGWLSTLWLVMAARYLHARHYFASHAAHPEAGRRGVVAGAALAGACWGLSIVIFPASPLDPVAMLLLYVLAGVSAFAGISLIAVPLGALLFQLAAMLPAALWLLASGMRLPVTMGAITLVYFGVLLLFMRTVSRAMNNLDAFSRENRALNKALEQAKVAERESALFRHILDDTRDPAIFVGDPRTAGHLLYVNEGACRHFGVSREELLTWRISDWDANFDETKCKELDAVLRLAGSVQFETEHILPSGERIPVEVTLNQVVFDGSPFVVGYFHSLGEQKNQESRKLQRERDAARQEIEQHILRCVENAPGFIYTFRRAPNGEMSFPFASRGIVKLYGLQPEDIRDDAMPLHALAHPDDQPHIAAVLADSAKTLTPVSCEFRIGRSETEGKWFEFHSTPARDADGGMLWHGIMLDITDRKCMEEALAMRERVVRTLIDNSPDTITRYDKAACCIYANPAMTGLVDGGILQGKRPEEFSGLEEPEAFAQQIGEVFATGADAEIELRFNGKDGREVFSHVRLVAERDESGKVVSVLAVGHDITELNERRLQVFQMAFYDSLTTLPNRALFNDRLHQMLREASRHGQQAAVMLLDLDRFKAVNDTMGHPAGDELLRETARRLTRCVRGYDTVARMGGDEFAVLLPEVRSSEDMGRVAGKLLDTFKEPFLLDGKEVFVGSSIGISIYPEDGEDADDLLKQADSAMYFAKRSGRNNFRFYSREMTANANERLLLESELRRGFGRGELVLYYQPKVKFEFGALVGSEALLRWQHPERGLVAPDKFIPIAEDSGLIVEIGAWVLHDACRTACEWNGPGKPLHKVAINLSARQFQSGNLTETVRDVLLGTGCRAEWIELEITESLLLDEDGSVLEMLEDLRAMGITIAIDDFGTGYSSLSYLSRFPIDTLKIDRSFTSRVTTSAHHAELVRAIISIAQSLNQQVVAEGVETANQAMVLHGYGCHIAQGYLYGKPVPKQAFETSPLFFGRTLN